MLEPITEHQAAQRLTWQYRAIEATKGNQTRLGAILIAVMRKMPKHPPRFHGLATIGRGGEVLCDFQTHDYQMHKRALAYEHVQLMKDDLNRLADHLKLTAHERIAMFEEVRKWTAYDLRAGANQL